MTDIELTELLSKDPENGLVKIIDTYSRLVYAVVYRKLSRLFPREDIEEVVSDVFYEFYQKRDRINFEQVSLKACLMTVATKRATDKFRKNRACLCEIPDDDSDAPYCDGPEEQYCSEEERKATSQMISSLGKPDSSIIIRRYWYGEKVEDIAKAIGLSPNAVTKRLKKSRDKLAVLLNRT